MRSSFVNDTVERDILAVSESASACVSVRLDNRTDGVRPSARFDRIVHSALQL